MATAPKDYLNNANLLKEILISQDNWADLIRSEGLDEDEAKERVPECMTPRLVDMIILLVSRLATSYRWRGYTWNEDMQSQAVMDLCRVGLKFDLEKATAKGNAPNPFGYYTQIAKRVFITYIEREKKQGKIKDDIIEMSDTDLLPSFTRQHEGEATQSGQDLDGTKAVESNPRLRKRKKKKKLAKEDDTSQMDDIEFQKWLDRKKAEFAKKD